MPKNPPASARFGIGRLAKRSNQTPTGKAQQLIFLFFASLRLFLWLSHGHHAPCSRSSPAPSSSHLPPPGASPSPAAGPGLSRPSSPGSGSGSRRGGASARNPAPPRVSASCRGRTSLQLWRRRNYRFCERFFWKIAYRRKLEAVLKIINRFSRNFCPSFMALPVFFFN